MATSVQMAAPETTGSHVMERNHVHARPQIKLPPGQEDHRMATTKNVVGATRSTQHARCARSEENSCDMCINLLFMRKNLFDSYDRYIPDFKL